MRKPHFSGILKIISLIGIIFLSSTVVSQNKYSISGYVRESDSRESLPGVNIYIPAIKAGTITNNYGFYSLTLPQGDYEVRFSFVGFDPVILQLSHYKDTIINIDLKSITLEGVTISAEKSERITETSEISVISLPIQQIRQVPVLLGEKDVFKTIQLMPGVQKGSEGNGSLYVRGGGPDQNLIILDDAPVYNAFHLFGFFSIFNGDAIKSVELVKGGFPARFGGRLSSVVEMTMKDGNRSKFSGEAGIGLISSRLVLEGPFSKDKSSWIISGRRTYIDVLARPFMSKEENAGYYFYDLNAKVNYEFGSRDRLFLSGYFGRDKFRVIADYDTKEEGGLYWQNGTGTLRWNHIYNPRVFSNTSLIYSHYSINFYNQESYNNESYSLRYTSGIRDLTLKNDVEINFSPFYNLRTGIHLINHLFTPSAIVEKDNTDVLYNSNESEYNSLEGGLYVENQFSIGQRIKANAGLRFSNFLTDEKHYSAFEPRISANLMISQGLSLKAGYAQMNQYIHLLSSTGLSLPTDLWVPSTDRIEPQGSSQISLGIAKDFAKTDLQITIEGYFKESNNIIGYKPGASFLIIDDPSNSQDFTWEDNVTPGKSNSYGIETLIHKKSGRLNGWIGYTLSWTKLQFDEINFGKEFWARYDRRHDISIVGIYRISKGVNFSATWVYGTGNAITIPIGEFPGIEHNPLTDALVNAGQPFPYNYFPSVNDYGEMNTFRMKPYHRLDFAFQFIKTREKYQRTWEIGAYNTYSRKNPFFYYIDYDYVNNQSISKLKQVSIFPIIPSITYSIKF